MFYRVSKSVHSTFLIKCSNLFTHLFDQVVSDQVFKVRVIMVGMSQSFWIRLIKCLIALSVNIFWYPFLVCKILIFGLYLIDANRGIGAPHVLPQKTSKNLVIKKIKHKNSSPSQIFSQPYVTFQENLKMTVHLTNA